MLKKIVLASAILASTVGVAVAGSAPAPYVGASLGITNNTVSISGDSIGSYRGAPFSLFAGYGGVVNQNFYLAGELTGTVGTINISDNDGLKTSQSYGISVIPGFMLSDNTMIYGRLGATRAHFTSASDWRNGGVFGLGMQTNVTQNIDIRTEYDYVAYKSVDTIFGSASPRADQFSLGLVYKFD